MRPLRKRRSRPATVSAEPPFRGWFGAGGGSSPVVQAPALWRGTTVQVCGLWPFATGSGTPMVGVPLGRSLISGATLCCDPISWFQDANLIHNPSCFYLGKPGLGKSTIIRRTALGLAGYGALPLICGDLKPDYVDLIEALDGQVIPIGRDRGFLNILDISTAIAAADRLTGKARGEVLADARARRQILLDTLITLARKGPPSDREGNILGAALRVLDERHDGVPVLGDLLRVIEQRPEQLRQVALDRGDEGRYQDITEDLLVSLKGLIGHGRLGQIFCEASTVQMRRDVPVVFDVSSIDDSDQTLQAAALVAALLRGLG